MAGLFDGMFSPSTGWLGLQPTQNDQYSPLDISALLQGYPGASQGPFAYQTAPQLGFGPQAPAPRQPPMNVTGTPEPAPNAGMSQDFPGAPLNISPQAFGPAIGGAPQSPQMPPQAAQSIAQAPQDAEPGIGDRLSAGFQGFAHGGALLPALGNLIGGLSTGQRQDAAGQAKLQKTGADPMTGQDTFAWSNPLTQTLKPATVGDGTQVQGTSLGAFSDAVKSGVQGQQLYEYLPPSMKSTVKAMIEGRMQPPAGAAMRSPQTMALINAANSIDPNFDAANWGVRSSLAKNYLAGGKQFQEMQAIGTVAGHLENLAKSADALDNTNFPMVNGVVNWVRSNTGDPRIARFGTDVQAVSNELSKAYRGGHVTEGDVKEWNSKINAASSPAQLKAVIGEFNDLLRSKREMIETGYKQGMGGVPLPSEFSSESEKSRKTFDNVAKWSGGETAPAAAQPPTATGPNGQKIILRNGQWVPMK